MCVGVCVAQVVLPVKVYTPFSRIETEGVTVIKAGEEEGVAELAGGFEGVGVKS